MHDVETIANRTFENLDYGCVFTLELTEVPTLHYFLLNDNIFDLIISHIFNVIKNALL